MSSPFIVALLGCLSIYLPHATYAVDEPVPLPSGARQVVKLTESEVCSACLTTVESMFLVAAEMRSMGDSAPGMSVVLPAVCNNPMMDFYTDTMAHGCNYLRTSDERKFENIYRRIQAEDYTWAAYKSVFYGQAKQICEHEFKACHVGRLLSIDKKDRTACTACQIVVAEMDAFLNVIRSTNYTHMSANVCATLGYKYTPYNWLEDMCSEIIDDYGVRIAKLMRLPVSDEAPLPPSEALSGLLSPLEICQRLEHLCPPPKEGSIQPERFEL